MAKIIYRDDGSVIDASFGVEAIDDALTIVVESRGGTQGQPGTRNVDYAEGLEILLARLKKRGVRITDAFLDSRIATNLPLEARRLEIDGARYPITIGDPADLQRRLGAAQTRIGREQGARGSGNRTKRIRLYLGFEGGPISAIALEQELAGPTGERKYWAFFANPEIYRIDDAVRSRVDDTWVTTGKEVRRGDRAIIWRGRGLGGQRGVVALGEVTDDPQDVDDSDNPFWVERRSSVLEARVPIRYVLPPNLPLWLEEHEEVVGALSVARARGGTVFNVTSQQWDAVVSLSGGWPGFAAAARSQVGRSYSNVGRLPAPSAREPFEVDPDRVDRGLQAHATTQDALADFLRTHGIEPRAPNLGEPEFDLAWERGGTTFVAEVKSILTANEEKQLRLGLGQVLRYRQKLSHLRQNVVAVLVPERRPTDASWEDLCGDLGVLVVWPGSFEALVGAHPTLGEAT